VGIEVRSGFQRDLEGGTIVAALVRFLIPDKNKLILAHII